MAYLVRRKTPTTKRSLKTVKTVRFEKPAKLSKAEQETILRFDREGKEAYLFTYSKALQKHMIKQGAELLSTNSHGGQEFSFPKNYFRFPLIPRNERGEKEEDV